MSCVRISPGNKSNERGKNSILCHERSGKSKAKPACPLRHEGPRSLLPTGECEPAVCTRPHSDFVCLLLLPHGHGGGGVWGEENALSSSLRKLLGLSVLGRGCASPHCVTSDSSVQTQRRKRSQLSFISISTSKTAGRKPFSHTQGHPNFNIHVKLYSYADAPLHSVPLRHWFLVGFCLSLA